MKKMKIKKKIIIGVLFVIMTSIIAIMPQVKANEAGDNYTVIASITDESKTVEQNKSVFVEMNIDDIEKVKSITGYIASTTDSEKYITVELQSTTQGKWYYFDLPSNTVVGQTYIMPMIQVVYKDGTTITGKATGEFKVIQKEIEDNKVSDALNKSDNTTAKGILPNTGKNAIMILVGVLVIFILIMIVKNKNIE